ncbi:hypothetical protein Agub_g5004 [Astrephomene gubernaculifera]|uniref:Uncharacterized protein n=1 Tax=Astrephomene gubernaculifera TaxID=47775 RepID=A0AAD3DL55_9CHLO|nr:hypothetical protein Agub_g5004 [Astrephomene gubernaculifera]
MDKVVAHATPAQLRQLELQQEEIECNAAKIQGFFHYLNFCDSAAFERCLGRSGKSPECLSRAPDGGPTPRKFASITTVSQNRKIRQMEVSRPVMLLAQRKDLALLTAEETMERLKEVFVAYTDPMLHAQTGRREMSIVGFCRLMRDCRLLDNRLTLVAADVIFTRVDAHVEGGSCDMGLGVMHVDFDGFMRCLRAVVRAKFPKAHDHDDALMLLARKWLLPFARDAGAGGGLSNSVDGLFSRSTMNLVRKYDGQLKKLFAWYSSIEETDPARVTWAWARDHSGTINGSQFVLMLLNFNVLPVLLSKNTAHEVFVRCEAENDGDELPNCMFYPAFLETLAEVALEVGKDVIQHLRAATSPDDLKLLGRYAECCPPPFGPKVLQVYQEVLASRGRDASSLDQHSLYDAEGVRRRNERQAAAALQREAEAQASGVVQRREGLRQRFALTRLRNFYRDVRTTNNNTTWPPERDVSPTSHRNGGTGNGDDGEIHVAFYDSERAIKTPRPVWIPVGNAVARRHSHVIPVEMPMQSGPAAGIVLGPAGSNVLLVDAPASAGGGKLSILIPPSSHARVTGGPHSGFLPVSPGAYVRSPKPCQLAIEDRDEAEKILHLADRLPYLCTPPSLSARERSEGSGSPRQQYGKPRAVTAPAEVQRKRDNDNSGPSVDCAQPPEQGAAGLGGGGKQGRRRGPSAEGSPGDMPSRPRLPPVQHQPHRAQATAAALASIAGQSPPPPTCAHCQPVHLPPASIGAPLRSLPSGSLAPLHPHLTLGPSPSQISILGVLGSSPSNSQRLSPPTSLRRRQNYRRKADIGGLPTFTDPADLGPSIEVTAALEELDRFDGSSLFATTGSGPGPRVRPWRRGLSLHA